MELATADRPVSVRYLQRQLAGGGRIGSDVVEAVGVNLGVLEHRGEVERIVGTGLTRWRLSTAMTSQRSRPDAVREDCVKILSAHGALLHMNTTGCRALGVPEDETEFGMQWADLLPGEVRRQGRRAVFAARTGSAARFAGQSLGPDGILRRWDNLLVPLPGAHGSIDEILCISSEIVVERPGAPLLRVVEGGLAG